MPIQITEEKNLLSVHVSGKLGREDYEKLLPDFVKLTGGREKLRILYLMEDFHGWNLGGVWEGGAIKAKNLDVLAHIERCAMVGDKRWQEVMTALCRPFSKAKIEFFRDPVLARSWLEED